MGDPSPRCARRAEPQQVLRECPLTPLRLPSHAAAAACRCPTAAASPVSARRDCQRRGSSARPGSERPRPRLQRHAPRLGGFMNTGGFARLPRGPKGSARQPPRRLPRVSPHPMRSGPSCLWRGVCPRDTATTAVAALDAPCGAHVGVSRLRCLWQLCGWRHPTTPSRMPHEENC